VIGLMKSLANELGPKGIRVNSINPAGHGPSVIRTTDADRAMRNHSDLKQSRQK